MGGRSPVYVPGDDDKMGVVKSTAEEAKVSTSLASRVAADVKSVRLVELEESAV